MYDFSTQCAYLSMLPSSLKLTFYPFADERSADSNRYHHSAFSVCKPQIGDFNPKSKRLMWGANLISLGRVSALAFLLGRESPTTVRWSRAISSTTALGATQYLLRYNYVSDVLEKRGPYREGHLNLAKKLIEEGKCLSGGPTGDLGMKVPTGALFIFTDPEAAKLFVEEDPYVVNGIVTGHSIEEWNVVVQKE